MDPRADALIHDLRLAPHPEGGHFAETWRSPLPVRTSGGARPRPALTQIYFLLAAGGTSRWHRLDADEAWHFLEGAPLDLLLLDAPARVLTRTRLGPLAPGAAPVHVVPAGSWLAARSLGAYTLVGCSMGPGFEAEGFALMRDVPEVAARTAERFPEVAHLI